MPNSYNPNDKLMHKAYKEGFRARSVYKLQELDQKFHFFKPGQNVLDLGAAPGSWLQYICTRITPGQSLGLDLKEIKPIAGNVKTAVTDITDLPSVEKAITEAGFADFDLIISDLAPAISGIVHADHVRSIELDRSVFEISKKFLRPSGSLLMKVFPGANLDTFMQDLKQHFAHVKLTKTHATRNSSSEMYIACQNKRKIPLVP